MTAEPRGGAAERGRRHGGVGSASEQPPAERKGIGPEGGAAERGRRHGDLLVLAAALCFGSTFPVTKEALDDVGPYALVALRFLAGGLLLLPWALRRPPGEREGRAVAWCSVALLAGYLLLTVGLQRTTSTAAAFICYLLVVIVPVLSAVLLRRPPSAPVVAGVVLATAGLFLLAGDGVGRLGPGEALVLGCAVAFAVHILLLDHFGATLDPVRFTAFQLLAVGVVALVPAAVRGELGGLRPAGLAATAFLGAAGLGGLLLQIRGQRTVGPSRTSLLLMLEPVLAAVGGYAIGERIAPWGFVGAALILLGILVSEAMPVGPKWDRRELPLDPRVRLPG
ncbi:MAG TPA: DMT family transporter [Acidimicrobiales bacterium]|nr:DMT family transporter [Acidimicrobiales bacterium]